MPKGRPSLAGVRKFSKLEMRLTDDERATLDRAAAIAGKATSTWGRDALLALAADVIAAHAAPAAAKPTKRSRKA